MINSSYKVTGIVYLVWQWWCHPHDQDPRWEVTLLEPPLVATGPQAAAYVACIWNIVWMQSSINNVCAFMWISFPDIMKPLVSQSVSLMVSGECSYQAALMYPCHEPKAHYPIKRERAAVWPLLPPTRITPGKWLSNYPLIVSPLHRSAFSSCRPALIESPRTQCINSNFAIEI